MQARREKPAIVLLCECPRREEVTHQHYERDADGGEVEIEVRGQKTKIPATHAVDVKGGQPRITLRPVEAESSEEDDSATTVLAGTCNRCGEIFSGTLTVNEAGLREPAPPAKEEASGEQSDQSQH